MHTQRQLLEAAMARHSWNWSQLADALSISRAGISKFKYGTPLSNRNGLALAQLCGMDEAYVIACIEHHSAERLGQTDVLPVWEKIAEAVMKAGKSTAASIAVSLLAVLLMLGNVAQSKACAASFTDQNIPYAKYIAAKVLNWLITASQIFFVTAILAAPTVQAADWSRTDIAEESAFQLANLADWGTTNDIERFDRGYAACMASAVPATCTQAHEGESAWALGEHPKRASINAYMGASALLHLAVSELLISTGHTKLEHVWQAITISEKSAAVAGNFSVGLHLSF